MCFIFYIDLHVAFSLPIYEMVVNILRSLVTFGLFLTSAVSVWQVAVLSEADYKLCTVQC